MADNAAFDLSELDRLIEKVDGITSREVAERIEAAGFVGAGEVVIPALVAATPLSQGRRGPSSLPVGALKRSVRGRVVPEDDGLPPALIVDFGRNTYIARFLDRGTARIAPTGFVRRVEDATHAAAEAAYIEEASAALEEYLDGGR